jgi:hypothetical protein
MDNRTIGAIIAIVVIGVVALLLILPLPEGNITTPVCGDGVCSEGEECMEECGTSGCQKDGDCTLFYGCCGNPFCVGSSDRFVPLDCNKTAGCPNQLVEETLKSFGCECSGGICNLVEDKQKSCKSICDHFKETDCKGSYKDSDNSEKYWDKNCPTYSCECFENKSIEERYKEVADRCMEAASNADDWLSTLESCLEVYPGLADEYREWCESQGGRFGYIGLYPVEECNLPTSDGGRECTDDSQCESTCLADLTEDQYDKLRNNEVLTGVKGTCSGYRRVVGCRPVIENGIVESEICVD